jgi:ABC-type lipoprotein release transport system permease subunit
MKWLRIQIHFIDFALCSMLRRKWRNAGLIAVFSLVVFMISSVLFFATSLREEARSILEGAPDIIVQRNMAGRHELMPIDAVESIRGIRGVRGVAPRLWGYHYHPVSRSNFTLVVPDKLPPEDNQAVIGHGVLRAWGADAAHEIHLKSSDGHVVTLRVQEVLQPATDLAAADLILLSESSFREITGLPPGFATDLAVTVRNPLECPNIARKVTELLPSSRPILKTEMERTYMMLFDWRSGHVIVLLSGAVLAFFIFAWEKATGMSAEEKREIGILKAVGWTISDILTLKLWEGAVIALTSFFVGVLAACWHVFARGAPLFAQALKGWAVLYPHFQLQPAVDAYQVGTLFLLTVMPYALIVVIPSWRAATADPDLIMRLS